MIWVLSIDPPGYVYLDNPSAVLPPPPPNHHLLLLPVQKLCLDLHMILEMWIIHERSAALLNSSYFLLSFEGKAMKLYIGYTHYKTRSVWSALVKGQTANFELMTWDRGSFEKEKKMKYSFMNLKHNVIFHKQIKQPLYNSGVYQLKAYPRFIFWCFQEIQCQTTL